MYAEENGLLFMETSAKTSLNVTNIFVEIAKKVGLACHLPSGHTCRVLTENSRLVPPFPPFLHPLMQQCFCCPPPLHHHDSYRRTTAAAGAELRPRVVAASRRW